MKKIFAIITVFFLLIVLVGMIGFLIRKSKQDKGIETSIEEIDTALNKLEEDDFADFSYEEFGFEVEEEEMNSGSVTNIDTSIDYIDNFEIDPNSDFEDFTIEY